MYIVTHTKANADFIECRSCFFFLFRYLDMRIYRILEYTHLVASPSAYLRNEQLIYMWVRTHISHAHVFYLVVIFSAIILNIFLRFIIKMTKTRENSSFHFDVCAHCDPVREAFRIYLYTCAPSFLPQSRKYTSSGKS
jgi:hypothetical protein